MSFVSEVKDNRKVERNFAEIFTIYRTRNYLKLFTEHLHDMEQKDRDL